MTLNHLNINVKNVAETKTFFENYFGLKCLHERGKNALAVMTDNEGFALTIMSEAFNKRKGISYPENFHIGFMVNTKTQVTTMYNKLKKGGISLQGEPKENNHGFGFYFHFSDFMIEVGC